MMENIDKSVKVTSHHHISGGQTPFEDVNVGAGQKNLSDFDLGENGSYFDDVISLSCSL